MTWKTLFLLSTFLWIGAFALINCTQQPTDLTPEGDMSVQQVANVQEVSATTIIDQIECGTVFPDNDATCADIRQQIADYREAIADLKAQLYPTEGEAPTLSPERAAWLAGIHQELLTLRGYRFSLDEIEWIAERAAAHGQESVYLAFAINQADYSVSHRASLGSPITYLDVYLAVQEGEGYEAYADFPTPCPTLCLDPPID